MSKNRPVYVLDTNVIIDYVDVIPSADSRPPAEPTIDFRNEHIVIPSVVVRELSNFKNEKTDRGKAARTALRRIRDLAEQCVAPMDKIYNLDVSIKVVEDFPDDDPEQDDTMKFIVEDDYDVDEDDYLIDGEPIEFEFNEQKISILPVHKNLRKSLPFHPSDSDMDGQIILTAIAVGMIKKGLKVDGTELCDDVEKSRFDDVVLVTNDNGLAIRARERGIKTERYGYKYPDAYTGRRDVFVPKELFHEFYNCGEVELAFWQKHMPDQPRLIANEFIVMKLENEADYPRDFYPRSDPYFSNIGRYDAESEAIVKLQHVSSFPIHLYNAGQAIYAEALMDPNIAAVICTGPAGSGKTYMAAAYGYHACQKHKFFGVTVVPCDSRSKLGALPGDLDEKMDPDVQPIKNALRNYLLKEDRDFEKKFETFKRFGADNDEGGKKKSKSHDDDYGTKPAKKSIKSALNDCVDLIWDNWFDNIPIEYARGRDFAYQIAIYDEFQDQTVSQADTLIKRLGTDGKIVITGDIDQIHAPYIDSSSSGLAYASRILMDDPMVAQVCFIEDEVMRHPLVKTVTKRQKSRR